ncbi:MAG: outer membrane protein assembly factor BamD [Bryobacterales bacterium]|nr:outer membrane protein assembly factor BamD [Bryobacterales bacterium]
MVPLNVIGSKSPKPATARAPETPKPFRFGVLATLGLVVLALVATGCGRKKYENPITKDTLQPDKILFDKAISDMEKGRYEVARITLNTLINTYDSSEYLAKAKLAIADSWYREGTTAALAQAEVEYKDFILFYPTMEESAEAQEKVCMIHYNQMEKPDRDTNHAARAEMECREVLTRFPNSSFAPRAEQLLRNIQEVQAQHEYSVADTYSRKGNYNAAANRLQGLTDHYPLFSSADDALWQLADAYDKMGDRFEERSAAALSRIVREYPLSQWVDSAKQRLTAMNRPVPEADPTALARMKYEQENSWSPGTWDKVWGVFKGSPEVRMAAKSGTPAADVFQPSLPLSVPASGGAAGAGAATAAPGAVSADVTVSTVGDSSALDTQPDARLSRQGQDAQPAPQPSKPAGATPPRQEE